MTLRCAVYCRVSSEAQRKERTIESQLREVPAFCRARGWTIVETYVDDGKSAATGKLSGREAFGRLLADAAAGAFDVVAVIAQDRLTRTTDLRERGAILGAFQAAGVQLAIASTGQVLDLRTDSGDMLGTFGAYTASLANRQRVEATTRGKRELIERGIRPAMDRAALREHVGLLRRWCEQADAPRRREMIRAVVEAAALRPGSIALDLRIPVQGVRDSWNSAALSAGRLVIATPRSYRRAA